MSCSTVRWNKNYVDSCDTTSRIFGHPCNNRPNQVGSTFIESWEGDLYPDFVTEGSGDQKAIMAAICAVKKAPFDGEDCVGEDATATGTVRPKSHTHKAFSTFCESSFRRVWLRPGSSATVFPLAKKAANRCQACCMCSYRDSSFAFNPRAT